MDFFNKLSKKTNEAYQSAKEKTAKLSGELKLKNKISDLKDKINKEYEEIGKLVYEKIKVGEDASKEEITPRCEEISRLKEEIDKAEVQILSLKDIKKCSECGTELSIEAAFCSNCGKEQPKVEKVEVEVKEEPIAETELAENAEVTEIKNIDENGQSLNTEENIEITNIEGNIETSSEDSQATQYSEFSEENRTE